MDYVPGMKVIVHGLNIREKGDYGISYWPDYLGKVFTIRCVSRDYKYIHLDEDLYNFTWPYWMIKPYIAKNSIKYYIDKRKENENRR